MTTLNANTTVGALVAERLARARVFEQFGIDYCCGGKRPLDEACREKRVPVEQVLAALRAADAQPRDADDPSTLGMAALADHIVATHHRYLRSELPRLGAMLDKVINAHAVRHPELRLCGRVFGELRSELDAHMQTEEQVLFPMIRALERGERPTATAGGAVSEPIEMLEHEHDEAGQALWELRRLTSDYTPPADACTTYRVLLDGLAALERDMHLHVHKENNVLFPRAAKAESRLTAHVG